MNLYVKLGLVVGLVAALWFGYEHVKQIGYKQCETELQAKNLELALAYAERITKAEEQRDKNQVIIDRLASQRVQVHFPVCPNATDQNSDGTAGVLSQRVEQSFTNLQTRGRVLFERCEALNADAIKLNDSVTTEK